MRELKLVRIGDAVGTVLPDDVRAELQVGEGDTLVLTDAPDGYRLASLDAELGWRTGVAERARETRSTLAS